jgi:hypothetical protein
MKQFGVETENMPLEAPWKSGKVERAGGLWKDILMRTVHEMQPRGLDDMILATSIITQCRNSFPRSNGYSPNQWVLGQPEIRLPGSLLSDEESQRLEILEAAEDPKSAMAKTLSIREAARVAQIGLDTDSRVRRALLHQSTPTRGPFPVGSYVYFTSSGFRCPKAVDETTNGLVQPESLAASSDLPHDFKMKKNFPPMVDSPEATGSGMVHQVFW